MPNVVLGVGDPELREREGTVMRNDPQGFLVDLLRRLSILACVLLKCSVEEPEVDVSTPVLFLENRGLEEYRTAIDFSDLLKINLVGLLLKPNVVKP